MGDATLHRHGDTIPGPDGPPIVPFPRKRAALSAPGGALVLSPLEIPPKERRGSDSGKRSRGRPICNTCVRRTFWCGGRTDLRFEYSAAGRGVSSLVGSAWRPTSVLGELTDKAVNSSLTFFLFHRARRIFFLMSQKENGVHPHGKTVHSRAAKWHHAASPAAVRRAPLRGKENVGDIPMGKAHFRIRSRRYHHAFPCRKAAPSERSFYV